jgi:integrase
MEQIGLALQKLPARERLMLRIMLVLGLRPGELLALRRNDVCDHSLCVDEGNRYGRITEPKSQSSASHVWLPASVKSDIAEWLDAMPDSSPEALLFPAPRGGAARLDNYYRKRFWRPAMEAAGLNGLTPQILRRSCGTFLADKAKAQPKEIQGHLRHAQVNTTMDIYVQEIPESTRKPVEMLDGLLFGEGMGSAV